jgi:hypothetical protein
MALPWKWLIRFTGTIAKGGRCERVVSGKPTVAPPPMKEFNLYASSAAGGQRVEMKEKDAFFKIRS